MKGLSPTDAYHGPVQLLEKEIDPRALVQHALRLTTMPMISTTSSSASLTVTLSPKDPHLKAVFESPSELPKRQTLRWPSAVK